MGDPREPHRPAHRAGARRRAPARRRATRARAACRSCATRSPRWCDRRFGVGSTPSARSIPTLGSKEAIFSFAQVLVDPARREARGARDRARLPRRRARRARSRARRSSACRCSRRTASSPTSTPSTRACGAARRSSGSTTRTTRPARPRRSRSTSALAALAAEHDFVLASDEAYTELWFDEPPPLGAPGRGRASVAVFNSLSQALLDDRLPLRLRRRRRGDRRRARARSGPPSGTAPQEFVQRASVVAWDDEAHVEAGRARYARKRESCSDVLARKGCASPGSEATMYLWVAVPDGRPRRRSPSALLEARRRRRRRAPTSAPPARATSASRSSRPRTSARRAVEHARGAAVSAELIREIDRLWEAPPEEAAHGRRGGRGGDAAARRGRVARGRAAATDGWVVNEWVKKAILLYFRLREMEPMEVGPFEYHDKIPLKRDYEGRGVRVVPPAVARYGSFLSAGRRADAELREHRRLGRPAHDGRHVGDRRLVRADRRRRPPRRAASASAACSSRRRRAR